MKEIQILFSKDLITKGLILKHLQKIQNNQDNISLEMLICYSHSWELQTTLNQTETILSLMENEIQNMTKTTTKDQKEEDWIKQKIKIPKKLKK